MGIRIWRETQREESNASMLLLLLLSGFECQSDVTAISRDSERGRGRSVALLGRGTYGVQVEDRGRYNLRIRNRICFDGQGADPRAWHGDSGGCSYGLPGRAGGGAGGGGGGGWGGVGAAGGGGGGPPPPRPGGRPAGPRFVESGWAPRVGPGACHVWSLEAYFCTGRKSCIYYFR
jgi:hypothetical protein